MQKSNNRGIAPFAALVLVAAAGTAMAQNAVGDGRALERPLMTPQVAAPPSRASFAQELMFREAVVSGQAPAGLSFRGQSLPSRFEFRGELGEDALFAYRRDSLYSGLAGRGIRGTEALQYQFALTTGGRIPSNLGGTLSYARAGETERVDNMVGQPATRQFTEQNQGIRRVDDSELLLSAVEAGTPLIQPVRSISTYSADRGMQPTLVGVIQNRTTQQAAGQTASPLLGLQVVPLDTLQNPAQPLLTPSFETPGALEPMGTDLATTPAPTAYDGLLSRFEELSTLESPGAQQPEPGQPPAWATDIAGIRNLLRGLPPSTARAMGIEPVEAPTDDAEGTGLVSPLDPNEPREPSPVPELADHETFAADVYRRIREAGGMSDTLIAVDQPQVDRYAAYMQSAQDLLAKERYFDAEEGFISAMTARPNDVNASVGRVHAQLGAGLFLSAGLNLRQLLVGHPEVAGMRYGERLLPAPERRDQIKESLRDEMRRPNAGADAGLLLAYLGFQTEAPDDVRVGLAAMTEHGDEHDARLADMLRAVWLGSAEPAPEVDAPAEPDGE